MCTFILESDTFSKCCHWHWRGGKRHCQHQVVIKQWSWLLFDVTVLSTTKTKGCPSSYLWAVLGHACSNHFPHLFITSCKMPHACPMLHPYQPVISILCAIFLWSYGILGSLLLFYLLLLLNAYQNRRMWSQWLFKWMQVWTNSLSSTLKKNSRDFQFHKLQFCTAFAFLESKPIVMSWLKGGGWWNYYCCFTSSTMVLSFLLRSTLL